MTDKPKLLHFEKKLRDYLYSFGDLTSAVTKFARKWRVEPEVVEIVAQNCYDEDSWIELRASRLETDDEFKGRLRAEEFFREQQAIKEEIDRIHREKDEAAWAKSIEDAFKRSEALMSKPARRGFLIAPCLLQRDGSVIYANVPIRRDRLAAMGDNVVDISTVRARLVKAIPGFQRWSLSWRPSRLHGDCPMPRSFHHITLARPGEYSHDGSKALDR